MIYKCTNKDTSSREDYGQGMTKISHKFIPEHQDQNSYT